MSKRRQKCLKRLYCLCSATLQTSYPVIKSTDGDDDDEEEEEEKEEEGKDKHSKANHLLTDFSKLEIMIYSLRKTLWPIVQCFKFEPKRCIV